MQLFEEVQEHIKQFEFSEAIEKCRIILTTDKQNISVFECLISLLEKNSDETHLNSLSEFLTILQRKEEFEKFYLYFKKLEEQNYNFSFSKRLFYLSSIWNLGRLKEFFEESKKLYISSLDQKYYNHLPAYYEFIEKHSVKQSFTLKGKIILACELGDTKLLNQCLKEFYDSNIFFINKKVRGSSEKLEEVRDILKIFQKKSRDFYKEYLKSEFLVKLSNEKNIITRKQKLDFFLLSTKSQDFYLLYEVENHLLVEEELASLIKDSFEEPLHKVPLAFSKTRNLLSSILTLAKVSFQKEEKEDSDTLEKPDLSLFSSLESAEAEEEVKVSYKKVVISDLEKQFIKQFDHIEYSDDLLNQLIVGFIEMDLLHSAKKLAKKLQKSANKSYLLAQISFNMNDFSSVIDIVNYALMENDFSGPQEVPFLYLKARSLENLNDKIAAYKSYQLISQIDPTFMNVGKKLQS